MKHLIDTKLSDLMPSNLLKDRNVVASASAIDEQLKLVGGNIEQPAIYSRIEQLTGPQLDHLAMQYDVEPWREYWTVAMKRSVIKAVYTNLSKRGTLAAVKDAIAALGSAAQIVEWWEMEPKGKPHTFTVVAHLGSYEGVLEDDLQNDLIALIDNAKPVRSHYTLELRDTLDGGVGTVGLVEHAVVARISDL